MRYAAHRIVRNEYRMPSKTIAALILNLLAVKAEPPRKLVAY